MTKAAAVRATARVATVAVAVVTSLLATVLPADAYGIVLYPSGCTQVPTSNSSTGWQYVCWQGMNYDSHADSVQAVQVAVNGEDGGGIATDSLYGSGTAAAVCYFQNVFGSETGGCDGIVGPKTWNTLRSTLAFVSAQTFVINGTQSYTQYLYSQNYYSKDFAFYKNIYGSATHWEYICVDGAGWLFTTSGYPPTTLNCR